MVFYSNNLQTPVFRDGLRDVVKVHAADVSQSLDVVDVVTDDLHAERCKTGKPTFFKVRYGTLFCRWFAFARYDRLLEGIDARCFSAGMAKPT
jgi:hypothetical protein